jgi:hypothetical protein
MKLKITYMGRSYDASAPFPPELELPADATVDDALREILSLLPAPAALPDSCLVVISGRHLGTVARHENPVLTATDEIVLIAPVAGG